jgi:outer membrane protein OmpA-like peptidoglycan-associated protein
MISGYGAGVRRWIPNPGMEDSRQGGNGGEEAADRYPPEDPLFELRNLLLAEEQAEVARLGKRLDDREARAQDVGEVLAEAVEIRSRADESLTDALLPTVEKALVRSVQRDPRHLVDALFPVMGPAIRKAIASTLEGMLQALNETLVNSFSAQGLKWRIEAWRTGRPLSEVVLLRTLVYRVEQVFLIHRKTGLLLQHVSASSGAVQDADMVSGMLTAIRDFVHDSFGGRETEGLDAFQVGELTVWVEQGPLAILAAVIRGNPPRDLKAVFAETIEKIHRDQARDLEAFEGDALPFERSRPPLEACLRIERQEAAGKAPRASTRAASMLLRIALAVMLAGIGLLALFSVRRNRRWDDYLARLAAMPGIVVTGSERKGGKLHVTGLRDPLAADPAAMLGQARLRPEDVVATWRPYQGLDPDLVLARARRLLEPPATAALAVRDGVLLATGSAPRRWIADAKRQWRAIPGIAGFEDRGLLDTDLRNLEAVRASIEGRLFLFSPGSAELSAAETAKLPDAAADLGRLPALAAAAGRTARVEVVGRGDSEGTEGINRPLSRQRAERVVEALRERGIGTASIAVVGVGSAEPLREERTEEDKQYNRSVSFRVVLADKREGEAPVR